MDNGKSLSQVRADQDQKVILRDLADQSRVIVVNDAITTSRSDMITHDRWQRIKEIFNSAQDRPPAERSEFLNEVCGDDPSVREEVEALLTADAANDDFLSSPAYEFAAGMLAGEASEFLAGQKIGRFEIQCSLGEGGMGQIYLAHDANLGRKIALKLIAREFATDTRRVHRFEQEARAASALNHPNVCVIHDVGITETGRHFIAMEYIQGITLREQIARGPFKPLDALQVTMQVGAALASAHAIGIVHRDIKPENIMLRPDGYVKVVDFGLAKLTEALPEQRRLADVNTLVLTEPRMLMGTVKYMSPEQLREEAVDERTDIWSLGIVLYEMLTGSTPFEARSRNDSIALILAPAPAELTFPDQVPVKLREIIRKALEKDCEERYQTVTKLTSDLSSLKRELERNAENYSAAIPAVQSPIPYSSHPRGPRKTAPIFTRLKSQAILTADSLFSEIRTHKKAALFAGVSSVLALLVFIPGATRWINQIRNPQQQAKETVPASKMQRLTNTGTSVYAAISPNGELVAHAEEQNDKQRIVVTRANVYDSRLVVPPEKDAKYVGITFSRDSAYLYLTRNEKKNDSGTLYRVAIPDRNLELIKKGVDSPISFSPQGDRFAFVRFNRGSEYQLVISNTDGTNEEVIATRRGGDTFSIRGPAWSPDGRTVVCPESRWEPQFHMNLVAFDVNNKREELITARSWHQIFQAAWQDKNLVISAREYGSSPFRLWRINLPDETPSQLTYDLDDYRGVSIAGGNIVTIQTNLSWNLWISRPGESEPATAITSGVGLHYGVVWTSQNKLVYSSMAQDRLNISRINPDGSEVVQLTMNAGDNYTPSASADGHYIVFASDRNGSLDIWRMNADDGSNLQQLTSTGGNSYPSCSAGGWVAYDNHTDTKMSVWKVPLLGGEPVKVSEKYRMPVFSPDNQFIACRYDEDSDVHDVAIFPVAGDRPVRHFDVPKQEWQWVQWLANGRQLSYVQNDNGYSNIWSYDLETGVRKQITNFNGEQIFSYAWSPDYKQVACQRGARTSDVTMISER
jgi:eukaryotic-like serine/threonine-protein kinase